ncbi:MAG: rhomboid family intramembrane serine protease [Xanthomonadales bacterium]|nr:rhomboid family intramembrane serine protease [Xanthomonadales bacterium]
MLIIPLHQKLTLARFPWVTALLIVINVLVYIGPQSRDPRAYEAAAEYYQRSGLLELELPWLKRHLESRRRADMVAMLDRLLPPAQARFAVQVQALDPEFAERIAGAPFHEDGDPRTAAWRAQRNEFEIRLSRAFTPRYALRFHAPAFAQHLSSMFLHGSADHLLGNMIFLALLGLMTEAALGPLLFLAVYLVGGYGAAVVSVWNHFGEFGSLVGASGAIAALMGACCVVWGMRKIRVFYWLFFIFDYVRVPALYLLPVWLGWELYQMLSMPDSKVAFDAHAGGIVTGALVTFGIRKLGWERREVLDEAREPAVVTDYYTPTRDALGKLEFPLARERSDRLIARHPDEREAWLLRLRAWRDRSSDLQWHEAARKLLVGGLQPPAGVDDDIALFNEYLIGSGHRPRLSAEDLLAIGARWLAGGRREAAEPIVQVLLNSGAPGEPARKLALRLALASHEAKDLDAARNICEWLHIRCADSEEARKLQRLLV